MNLPLIDETIKQISGYEGDTDFLYAVYAVCNNEKLTDKQKNFCARTLGIYYKKINVTWLMLFLHDAIIDRNKTNKEIEAKLKELINS